MLITAKSHAKASSEMALAPFLGIPFAAKDALVRARQQLADRVYPRRQLAALLRSYNESIGNAEPAVMDKIDALQSADAPCVVTGQQLGLMGGPAYTILKAVTCLRVARDNGAVPIFWLATEDHDIAEIDHTYLLGALGNLQRFHLAFAKDGRSVEDLMLSPKHVEEIERFLQTAGIPAEAWAPIAPSYAQTMAQVLVKLFAGSGMVFLEPRLLRPLAAPFFRRELEEHAAIQQVLMETTRRLKEAGGTTPLVFEGGGPNLFLKSAAGQRQKLRWDGEAFVGGAQRLSLAECLALCDSAPERFSPNAAARPVLQSALLPVLAYVAGPSEMAYHRQLADYHRFHGVPMPCVVPRIAATLIPPLAAEVLDRSGLEPWEAIPQHWPELMPTLSDEVDVVQAGWLRAAARAFGSDLDEQVLSRTVKQGARKLMRKVVKARLARQGLPAHGLHLLRNLLFPHGKPQERVLNWWGFQSETTENLVEEFIKMPPTDPEAHLYCYLS